MLEDRTVPATFTVTTDADVGAGSLRQAVLNANTASGADLIDFSNYFNTPRTIMLASQISITGPVTIDGPSSANVTISGNDAVRIFDTQSAPTDTPISLVDLTLTLGHAPTDEYGGAVRTGDEALSLTRCNFTANTTDGRGGGAIFVDGGTLTATECVFKSNSALFGYASGGGILFYSPNGNAALTRCVIADNVVVGATARGGGLSVNGTLILESSTVSGNQASGVIGPYSYYYPSYGGGIDATGSALIRNCTISGNSSGVGGGINANTLSVQNSTITGNAANDVNGGGGIWATKVTLESSIVALNSAYTSQFASDIFAFIADAKTSSIYNHTDVITFNDLGGNRPAFEDPRLGPLQNNGGPTMTHSLLPGSPCVDVGSNPANLSVDQRGPGFPRVLNGKTDIGAYEGIDPIPIVTPISMPATITSTGGTNFMVAVRYDDGTGIDLATIDLNDIAVTGPGYAVPQSPIARAISGSGQVVTVTYTLPAPGGTFDYLDDGQYSVAMVGNQVGDTDVPVQHFVAVGQLGTFGVNISIPGPLVVDEPSDIEDANFKAGHFSLREALRMANGSMGTNDIITFSPTVFGTPRTLDLAAGELAVTDPLTLIGPGAGLLTLNAGGASRLFNINLSDWTSLVSLSGLTLINGMSGGILANAKLTVSDSVINNCQGTADLLFGGGIYAGAGLTLSGVVISNCTATSCGGGVFAYGTVVIERSSFVNNVAGVSGGGLYIVTSSTMQISDSAIVGNSTNSSPDNSGGGGGIFISILNTAGSFIRNSTISNNVAAKNGVGGGIFLATDGALPIANSTITGNMSPNRGGGICGRFDSAFSVVLNSTIIAGNSASIGPDMGFFNMTTVTSNKSLIGVANAGGFTLAGTGNKTGTLAAPLNPMLAALANNGGSTKTHALLPGSPAIDAGNNAAGLTFDQRGTGFVRVYNGKADIGAFEVQPNTLPPCVGSKAVIINGGATQRSRVTSVTIDFDQVVTLPVNVADAFQLKRQSDNALVALTANVKSDSATHVTLTFTGALSQFGSLEDGRYTIMVLASKVSNANGKLDGDCNGIGGDDFVLASAGATGVFRLFGDSDGNAAVNSNDFAAFRTFFGLGASIFDFNNDGQTNSNDFAEFRKRFGLTI